MKQSIESAAISHELALHIASLAIDEGAKAGLPVSVTIVDGAHGGEQDQRVGRARVVGRDRRGEQAGPSVIGVSTKSSP